MNTPLKRTLTTAALIACLTAGADAADDHVDPYELANNTWISLSGTVHAVSPDTFELDYGEGNITVEMDDGDRDADAYKLLHGDKVTVNGIIDDDLFEVRTIEASSVYVEKLGTHFYASAVDEEDYEGYFAYTHPVITISEMSVLGEVKSVNPSEDEFVIDTGLRELRVETDQMAYDPLDDEGYQKIRKGQRVYVNGWLDNDFFEGRELEATTLVVMEKKNPKKQSTARSSKDGKSSSKSKKTSKGDSKSGESSGS